LVDDEREARARAIGAVQHQMVTGDGGTVGTALMGGELGHGTSPPTARTDSGARRFRLR
jgi:hypothetical protein